MDFFGIEKKENGANDELVHSVLIISGKGKSILQIVQLDG